MADMVRNTVRHEAPSDWRLQVPLEKGGPILLHTESWAGGR
jgi:hypothetical protein